VAEAVRLLLEQQGLKTIELGKAIFEPAPNLDLRGPAASAGLRLRPTSRIY
jgi:hypothetical protein